MRYSYQTQGTCSQQIDFDLDGDTVRNIDFYGGCNGNLKGISILCDGMTVDEIEDKLKGVQCGYKPTSCPDQLARAVRAAYDMSQKEDGEA
ncbi:MAG: TIGR03905 family TSCPD domain-containing protein [Oscillospiraceae bacterium]|nr:TIGR03905 family TSCPD domain-containing protein [Oscillospiraceae bacterium]